MYHSTNSTNCKAVLHKEINNKQKGEQFGGVVDLPEANQLLKYKPEAVPTLNSRDNMCTKDAQEYYFLFAHN